MVNEYLLRIVGSIPVTELDASKETIVKIPVSIYAVEKRDNHDGTFNIVYKSKATSFAEFTQGDKVVRGKDKSKKSVRLRMAIMQLADELGEDREEYYSKKMEEIISKINQ